MLGSAADAEDAIQDSLLGAWRGLSRFEGRSSFRSWLYRIATNGSLKIIERRPKRVLPIDYGPPAEAPRSDRRAACRAGLDRAGRRRLARPRQRARLAGGSLRASRERRLAWWRLRKPAGSLLGRARLVGPHRRGGLPLVPEIDAPATFGSARTTTAREHRAARGARDCAAGAAAARAADDDRAADPPLRACARLRWRPAAWRRVAASCAGVLAGVTPGAAVSTYGV
jgi:Sigma-70 region 2